MNTETLVAETIRLVGKHKFVLEMDAIGWRGDYSADPARYLSLYIANSPEQDQAEANEFVRNDVIVILNAYGFDYSDEKITDIVL